MPLTALTALTALTVLTVLTALMLPHGGPGGQMSKPDSRALQAMLKPLRDRIAPGLRVLFVGINPGVRSAMTGHHFAGFSNRFWKLLTESALVPEPITFADDHRLPEWGLGITNLIARPTPGIGDLKPAEYVAGWTVLERKIARYRPEVVALVGVTLYRALLPLIVKVTEDAPLRRRAVPGDSVLGLRPETIHGARLFILPNPSGRNANFSYAEMLAAFRALNRYISGRR
jgi:TDG/mug DNA glycosylase family protein